MSLISKPRKPFHPATVHFPIAFLALSFGLDALYAALPRLPKTWASSVPPSTDLTRASYYLMSLGLITAIPAVMSGGVQAVAMFNKQGMYESNGKTLKTKVKATIAHGILNDVVLAVAGYIWYTRRTAAQTVLGKLGVGSLSTAQASYAPDAWMVGTEVAILGLMFYAASVGGALTYNFGVGMSIGSGKKTQ